MLRHAFTREIISPSNPLHRPYEALPGARGSSMHRASRSAIPSRRSRPVDSERPLWVGERSIGRAKSSFSLSAVVEALSPRPNAGVLHRPPARAGARNSPLHRPGGPCRGLPCGLDFGRASTRQPRPGDRLTRLQNCHQVQLVFVCTSPLYLTVRTDVLPGGLSSCRIEGRTDGNQTTRNNDPAAPCHACDPRPLAARRYPDPRRQPLRPARGHQIGRRQACRRPVIGPAAAG
jgi:hypothetical protein